MATYTNESLEKINKRDMKNIVLFLQSKLDEANKHVQSWTKGWREIHKIKQNRFFYGMLYS